MNEQQTRASCEGLPPAVVDKYFMADGNYERFQYRTAQIICGQCAVQASCLIEAIEGPRAETGVRGGESAARINDLRSQLRRGVGSAADLAQAAIEQQQHRLPIASLRAGRFSDVPLIGTASDRHPPTPYPPADLLEVKQGMPYQYPLWN